MTTARRGRRSGRRRLAALGFGVALLTGACGSDQVPETGPGEGPPPSVVDGPGPTVASDRFNGLFAVSELRLDGGRQEPLGPIVFEVDTEYGSLSIETPCGTLLGSFTLFDSGEASITIAGRSTMACPGATEAQTGRLLSVLGEVSAWEDNEHGFDLVTPTGDTITLLG
jgi:hypothetical protein